MKECNKFIDSLILYYNPPDYNSLADYNSPDLISAEEIGIRKGWKAALEWVKEKLNCEIMPGDIEYFIDKELEE